MSTRRGLLYWLMFTTLISTSTTTTSAKQREEEQQKIHQKTQPSPPQQADLEVNLEVNVKTKGIQVEETRSNPMPPKQVEKGGKPNFQDLPSCNSQQHKNNKKPERNYGGMDTIEEFDSEGPLLVASSSDGGGGGSSDRHFLVSTLDGKLTLLDQSGKEVWSVHTGKVFSSTISSLELSENGKFVKLIPSLTGGLYKYDEESILPMPMNVDSLLHKSFKLAQDVVINGGKELRTLGIDLKTGRLRYDCGMSGCVNTQSNELQEAGAEEPVTLVVKKQLQTVRAVDIQTGSEKWNFSVGMHEIGLTGVVDGCVQEENDADGKAGPLQFVKVVIPEGRLLSADPSTNTVWDKKFANPIAQAWVLERGRLTYVDPVQNTPIKEGPLALYVGKHNSQFYVQESRPLTHKLEKLMGHPIMKPWDQNKPPKISWKPSYLIEDLSDPGEVDSATALTTLNGLHTTMRPFYVLEHDEIISPSVVEFNDSVEYVDAFTTTPAPPKNDHATTTDPDVEKEDESENEDSPFNFDFGADDGTINVINQVIIASLWVWWKEVLGISLLTALLLNIILMRPLMRAVRMQTIRDMIRYFRDLANRNQQEGQFVPSNADLLPLMGSDSEFPRLMDSPLPRPRTISDSFSSSVGGGVEFPEVEIPYLSQYLREFEPVQCLGKGGFGVVFEAKKKIDDRSYAVKRIALPNREEARVRVMREVKALAQLDHKNIVRYFNAWIEHPPNGWLEKNDPLWTKCKIGSMTPTVEEPVSGFPTTANYTSYSEEETGNRRRPRRCTLKPILDLDVSAPLLEEEDSSYIVFDDNAEIPSKRLEFPGERHGKGDGYEDSESFLEIHPLMGDSSIAKRGKETTIDLSSDLSTSQSGFWKKPNSDAISWGDTSSFGGSCNNKSGPRPNSLVLFESKVCGGGDGDDEVEVGEEAQETESVSVMYLYIQQELCQKRTLREWLRSETTRDLRTVVNFFSQIVDAVEYTHSKKLIHRDLKPSNIFLAGNSEGEEHVLKIGDFGLATTVLADVGVNLGVGITDDEKIRNGETREQNLTSQVGTHLYMSPEQFKRKPYDYKVDIYTLGLIFFELLVPFHTEMERHDVLSKVRKVQIPSYFKDSYPEEHSVITQMISHNPHQRPDATSISVWVKSHLRNIESFDGGDDGWSSDKTTQRSNSSPANISLSRNGSTTTSSNDSQSRSDLFLKKLSFGDGDGERKTFHKSHSFTSL